MINGMKAVLQQLFAQAEQIADSRTTQHLRPCVPCQPRVEGKHPNDVISGWQTHLFCCLSVCICSLMDTVSAIVAAETRVQ